jgi:hypothetical protein
MMRTKSYTPPAPPIVVVAVLVTAGLLYCLNPGPGSVAMNGSFLASDAGQSHGGFEYVAVWDASLAIYGNSGRLMLSLSSGLGDALTRHEYFVSSFYSNQTHTALSIDGIPVVLVWTANDTVWNHSYDNYYIASWGGSAPPDEIRGAISPAIFPGLVGHYYVELRLR